MTINQNTTKINTIKNTILPELLQKINSLPDAGSGGGSGGIKTCQLKGLNEYNVYFTTVENGEIVSKYIENCGSEYVTVVCDTIMYLAASGTMFTRMGFENGYFTKLYSNARYNTVVLKAPSINGVVDSLIDEENESPDPF